MKVLNIQLQDTGEHRRCACYTVCGTQPLIDKVDLHCMQEYLWERSEAYILMVYKGKIQLCLSHQQPFAVDQRHLLLVSPGSSVHICAQTQSQLLWFSLQEGIHLCPSFRLEELVPYAKGNNYKPGMLRVNPGINCYLNGLLPFLKSELWCQQYLRIKLHELLFCLRGYYSKEELACLFSPVLSEDFIFRDRVYACLRKNLKVGELAQELGMCYTRLISLFHRMFATSPKEFINTYKKEQLLHELRCGIKPLKTLPFEYGFSSYSALTRFCITHLGAKPTDIRSDRLLVRTK
ncbi:MAG: AraC family transcriptional regulator [Bacteroides sp.]|nr:AraC family transcriptional regulator [Bacteroides sp.]